MSHDYPDRIRRLLAGMAERNLDALVVLKPQNSFYMSGFNPIIYSHPVVAVLTRNGDLTVLVHVLRDSLARAGSFAKDVRLYGTWSTKVTMSPHWLSALAQTLADHGVAKGRIGMDLDFISVTQAEKIGAELAGASLIDASELIMRCRYVKDADEIASARVAARLADLGMDAAVATLRQGGSEREISVAAMHRMQQVWADELPDRIVADFGNLEHGVHNGLFGWSMIGERMFLNTAPPTQRRPVSGECVSLLVWSVIDGIHIENERTVLYGDVPAEQQRAVEAVLEIRAEVMAMIRPGVLYSDLFEASRQGLARHGYGAYIPGRIGHSMGLGAHELPSIDAATHIPLQAGMMMAIEPNIRIPDQVATQISDTVLVTETGCELLTLSESGLMRA